METLNMQCHQGIMLFAQKTLTHTDNIMPYTTVNDPSAYFQTATYTGSSSSVTVTNGGNSNLRPDWLWIKSRSSTNDHNIFDSNRGFDKRLWTNQNSQETTGGTQAAATDGFTTGTYYGDINNNGDTYVAWQWAAGGVAPTKTYKVVVVSDSGNKYRFRNSADNATYAASAVTLDLQEGGTYTFDVSDNTVDSHPFVIGTSANSNEYSTGVTYKLDGVTKTYSQYTSGFSAATTRQLIITVAASAPTLYYWCSQHSGMGGQINTNTTFGSTNFDGSILTKVSANTTAGFSIATWTGNGSAGATIGHGLGAVPGWMIVKKRSGTDSLPVYHHKMASDPQTDYMHLNENIVKTDSVDRWNDTAPTSTVASLGDAGAVNGSSATYVGYFFSEIKGYSKFGSYAGSGQNDGPFIYTGFRPAFLIIKRTDSANNWWLIDTKRDDYQNPFADMLTADNNDVENANTPRGDLLSNGFKWYVSPNAFNASGGQYIYMAFAQSPMVGSNNIVGTAR